MIQVVKRVFKIIEELRKEESLSLRDLSARVGLNKTTVHNIVKSLIDLDVIVNKGNGVYALGSALERLGARRISAVEIASAASTIIESASEQAGETVIVAIIKGVELVVIAECESRQAVVVRPETYRKGLFYEWATGRVLLAHVPPETLEKLLETHGLPTTWLEANNSRERMEAALERVRRDGYATSSAANGSTRNLAVPVRAPDGTVVAALGIVLPSSRWDSKRLEEVRNKLVQSASQISARLLSIP
jgi:DNA-binding IclR family transcriptional regulator